MWKVVVLGILGNGGAAVAIHLTSAIILPSCTSSTEYIGDNDGIHLVHRVHCPQAFMQC